MLLLLLVCLMKIVDMAAINKHRKCCGGGLDSKENCAQNGQYQQKSTSSFLQNLNMKNQKFLNSQQYEQQLRLFQQHQRYQLYQQHQQQQQQRQRQQQQYEQILLYQKHLQQQKQKENQLLKQRQQQLHEKQQLNQQQKQRMQYHNNYIKNKQSQDRVNLLFSKLCNSSYYNFEKGNKPLCGMTEYPINEKQKSRQSQLNHNSSPHHYHNTTNTYYHHHPANHYIAHQQKRPLTTSPNNTIPYNYGISNFNYQSSPTSAYGDYQIDNDKSFDNTNINSIYDDELTEETLKRNVQIVLNNLDRYNNALRSIILNDQTNFINYNNNSCSNSSNNSILTTSATAAAMANILSSPESDYNSNATSHHPFGGHLNLNLNCSVASSHDFTHDNSDYQWFLDYGYRDGGFTHQSVLSSLSASYNGIGELSYYEDLAKNIDANLAEVDMESFCAEDIHSLLTQLPSLGGCNKDNKRNNRDDQNDIDNSICKSELLFSPVKESHISIDSLDLESYPDDGDIILTCKANKDNYTIAFEGSTLYSDESFYAEPVDPNAGKNKQNYINLHSNLDDIVKRKSLEVSMSRSDHAFTTWSKLKKGSSSQLQRYPSGNNNTSVNIVTRHSPHCIVRKSSSLPNLRLKKESDRQLNVSQAVSNSTVDSFKSRNLLPMCQMPVSSTSGTESPVHTSSNMHSTDNSSSKQHNNQPSFNLVKLFIKQKSNSSDTCMDISSGCWPSDASSSSEQQKVIRCGGRKNLNDSGKGSAALSRHDEENVDVNNDSSYQLDSLDICDQQNTVTNTNKDTTNVTIRKAKNDLYREVFETQTQQRNYMNTKDCSNSHINTTTTTTTSAATTRNHHQPLKNPQIYNLTVQNSLNNNNNSINNNNLNNNNNNNSMERDSLSRDLTNKSISDTSRTSDNLTQIFYNNSNNRMKIPVEMITRSMQTSNLGKDRLRFVPPSFLAKLNTLGEEKKAPVYVIYPNYALPDLGFVKNNISDVILSPFNYKNAIASKRRPTSFTGNDEEAIKQIDYKHIADWKSLVTLLPVEYRKRLTHIPEADVELDPECSQKPLFCMTPPLRRNKTSFCDCATYLQQTCTTSSSGSSQQPSSGYRGSSTLLTDSEVEGNIRNDNNSSEQGIRNVQPYQQFDCNRIETDSIVDRPPPSGRTPRSILRRNLKTVTRTKRNSMFEEDNVRSKNVEKRRSLQEPYYAPEDFGDVEDYLAELEDNRVRQYYQDLRNVTVNNVKQKSDINFTTDLNAIDKKIRKEHDIEARIRAENFLSSVPKSELKYYAEIANILEAADNYTLPEYDPAKLKNEVSRALCQKKVSFNNGGQMHYLNSGIGGGGGLPHKFSTPPNSPNISMATLRMTNNTTHHQHQHRLNEKKELSAADKEKQEKISSNRFKRLQIQWELLSTDSSMMLKDLAREKETKSGGSTPTSANAAQRSRIPRPVSYPASKKIVKKSKISSNIRTTVAQEQQNGKNIRSPSRIVPPKKYSVPPLPNTATTGITSANSGGGTIVNTTQTTAINNPSSQITRPRTPNRPNTTPKKRIPSPRPATRTR